MIASLSSHLCFEGRFNTNIKSAYILGRQPGLILQSDGSPKAAAEQESRPKSVACLEACGRERRLLKFSRESSLISGLAR